MKKIISVLLSIILILGICSVTVFAAEVVANPTNSKITINGEEVKFDAYNINGNNYFKLRDIAYVLSDTDSCFSVNWVAENNSANLIPGEKYSSVGGEMSLGSNEQKSAKLSNTNIMVNDETVTATAYLIDNSNYFKLRDLGTVLDFAVNWNNETQTIEIDTDFEYIPSNKMQASNLQVNYQYNSSKDSWMQQFLYKNEGMGYAYSINDGTELQVVLPNSKFTVEMLQPILADVVSDEDGYIYVVWGHVNYTDNTQEETIFISKYNSSGELIISKGYTNPSQEIDVNGASTPFSGGNTRCAIGNGQLVVHFSKLMYNGHQSNGILAVKMSDLTLVDQYHKIFVSHCFGGDILWSDRKQEFLFLNKSDAASRGFILQTKVWYETLFDFYLPENAETNMSIVNETYAQLGGLIEITNGFAFCAASVKSIGPEALEEEQNLFIQFFDIDTSNGETVYFGGENRTGENSWYNMDKKTVVTNKGVRWLTNYEENSVVVPQIVKADDKIVILWSVRNYKDFFCKERYYMVLNENGDILVPETPLEYTLNSFEQPIYYNGTVYWIYYDGIEEKIGLAELKIN